MSDVLRVHEWSYISLLQKASASCTDSRFAALDSDTIISKGSFSAALAAAGAVITAVDSVMEEQAGGHLAAIPQTCSTYVPEQITEAYPDGTVCNTLGLSMVRRSQG